MIEETRLSSKGQIIIPKAFRLLKGLKPGDEFQVSELGDSILLTPLRTFKESSLDDVFGCLTYDGPALSLEDMEAGIAEGARRVDDRD